MKKPSLKIMVALLVSVVVIGGIWYISSRGKNPNETKSATGYPNTNAILDLVNTDSVSDKDSDNDGLKDWEEVLWKTDLHNPDTDGDGTSDSAEVATGRDPTKKGPGDKLPAIATQTNITSTQDGQLTETEKVTGNLLTEYMDLKQQGITIGTTTKNQLILNAIASSQYVAGKVYKMSDLNVGGTDTRAALQTYADTAENIMLKNSPTNSEYELDIFKQATLQKNEEEIKKLDPIIAGWKAIIAGFLKMQVPKSIAVKHLALVNTMSAVEKDVESMRLFFSDPLTGQRGLNSYKKTSFDLYVAFTEMQKYLSENGIDFSK